MVYPPIATELTNRSSLEQLTQSNPIQSQSPVPSILLSHHHQQYQQPQHHQHQQIIYTPYNTIQNCIPPTNPPQCIYPNSRRLPANSAALRNQDSFRSGKNSKWKSRSIRVKEHRPNSNLHHVPYAPPPPPLPPPPLILFDPLQSHLSTTPTAPITSLYLNHSSTLFNHGSIYSNDNYTNFNPNVLTQPYYKPPEMQTYCLIDRSSTKNTFTNPQIIPPVSTYYNATSSNNVNQQNIKSFIASASNIYSNNGTNDSQIFSNAAEPTQILSNSLVNHDLNLPNYPNDQILSTSMSNDLSIIKCPEKIFSDKNAKLILNTEKLSTINSDNIKIIKSHCDERFSDESSNFDFTIEAEKMVSALCNTTSCDLDNDEEKNIEKKLFSLNDSDNNDNTDKFNENIDESYKPRWYYNDYSSAIKISGESIGTQTTDTFIDKSQYPELIRKTIFWGCNEADNILKTSPIISPKQSWLQNLSSATKIALTKSSTCIPIFSGDKVFSQDLMSALLRVGNGWLILDHYLNKQHNPNLNDKYDNDLIESFKKWQVSTNNLLENVIKTFVNLQTNNFLNDKNILDKSTIINSSFPGDISLYVNYGLFGDPPPLTIPLSLAPQSAVEVKSTTTFTRKFPYTSSENHDHKSRWAIGKESKLRSKWTISEHSKESNEVFKKNHDDKINCYSFPNDFTMNQMPKVFNTVDPQQKLQCNSLSLQNDENSNNPRQLTNINSILNTETLPINSNQQFWKPCIASNSSYNFTYSDRKLTDLSNKIEIDKTNSNNDNTINLSDWFENMRNKRLSNIKNTSTTWLTSTTTSTVPIKLRESKNFNSSSSRMDTNRQLRTLKNMRTIQCAPWTANHLIDDQQNSKSTPDGYDSSEDVRIYMKPGSYNVPKKKNQSRRAQRRETSTSRVNRKYLQKLSNNDRTPCKSNSLVVLRTNISSSLSPPCTQDVQSKDVTWKAACASAGLLLDTLKSRENLQYMENNKIINSTPKNSEIARKSWKNIENSDNKEDKTDIKLTNDDSISIKLSTSDSCDEHQKNNIKTDSWLIRTLNNVTSETNNDCKQTKDKSDDKKNILQWKKLSDSDKKSDERSFSLETSHTIAVMTLVDAVGKATYSETVRRFSSMTKPTFCLTSKTIQQKNTEHREIENNSLSSISELKNEENDNVIKQEDIKIKTERTVKMEKNKNSNDDRDWSVWYSSKRKHHNNSLGHIVLGKLENIHGILWRLDVSNLLKCPMTNIKITNDDNSKIESINIEHYRKLVKSPIFLDTIGHKLKNHEYRKIKHVIRDFRKIIYNSKLYHKTNKDCIEKIENLSNKLEELLQENFADELLIHESNCSPIQNQKSPNRFSISNNNAINSPSATLICNEKKEIALSCGGSTNVS